MDHERMLINIENIIRHCFCLLVGMNYGLKTWTGGRFNGQGEAGEVSARNLP